MRKGVDVIYQATFFDGRWRGHADFLFRVDTPSDLGDWSYEVADAKLARRVKAAAILQMCAYSEQLAALQGVAPRHIHVITGDGEHHTEKLSDYSAYYRALKARYEELVLGDARHRAPTPRRSTTAASAAGPTCAPTQWRADDHLSLVAGMRRDQTRKLVAAGMCTTTALGARTPGRTSTASATPRSSGSATRPSSRSRAAGSSRRSSRCSSPSARPPTPIPTRRGSSAGSPRCPRRRPATSSSTWRATPTRSTAGSSTCSASSSSTRTASRATTPSGPTTATRSAPRSRSSSTSRWASSPPTPNMHIYHYAPYEPTAIKRLMGVHGTRETEVDVLLRGERFVDLYAVVRQGVRIGSESYSLKTVEQLYMQRPTGEVMDAGGSIVAYEAWLDSHDQAKLDEIEAYNDDDCRSTLLLRDWLEDAPHRGGGARSARSRGRVPRSGEASEELTAREEELEALAERLRAREHEHRAYGLLAELLHWHRREEKPEWWAYFHRIDYESDDDFTDDRECIGGLELKRKVGDEKKSTVYRYEFEPQDHKFSVGSEPFDPATGKKAGEIVWIDDARGLLDLKRGAKRRRRAHPRALIPGTPVPTKVLRDAIADVAEWVADHGIDAPGPHRAIRDLLLRRPPERLEPGNGSYLAVQGPPGSGKTYTARA